MSDRRSYSLPQFCSVCQRAIRVTVRQILPQPWEPGPAQDKWVDGARREIAAKFERTHAATCGRKAR